MTSLPRFSDLATTLDGHIGVVEIRRPPFNYFDAELVAEVLDVMNDLAASGMTMIVVTHEMGFARNVSHNTAFMDGGRLIEYGPSDRVLTRPENPRTADFLRAVQR